MDLEVLSLRSDVILVSVVLVGSLCVSRPIIEYFWMRCLGHSLADVRSFTVESLLMSHSFSHPVAKFQSWQIIVFSRTLWDIFLVICTLSCICWHQCDLGWWPCFTFYSSRTLKSKRILPKVQHNYSERQCLVTHWQWTIHMKVNRDQNITVNEFLINTWVETCKHHWGLLIDTSLHPCSLALNCSTSYSLINGYDNFFSAWHMLIQSSSNILETSLDW